MAKKQPRPKFAVCVNAKGDDDLRVWKLYRVLTDAEASSEGYLRVVDESGEDYLYPHARFVLVEFRPPSKKSCWPQAEHVGFVRIESPSRCNG